MTANPTTAPVHPHEDPDGIVRDGDARETFFRIRQTGKGWERRVMCALHAKYNVRFFDGSLRSPSFKVYEGDQFFGRFSWETNYGQLFHQKIMVHRSQFDWYDPFRDTFLHEMCHQYVRSTLMNLTEEPHGPLWQRAAERVGIWIPDGDPDHVRGAVSGRFASTTGSWPWSGTSIQKD